MSATAERLSRLTFDEESHQFHWDGERVPSVTEILKSAGMYGYDSSGPGAGTGRPIPEDVMEHARDRGKAIHLAAQLFDENDLDWETLPPEVSEYLDCYKAWRDFVGFVPTLIEQPIFDEKLKYAGICDRAGYIGHQFIVLDIKTTGGLKIWHPKQLAAYAQCIKHEGGEWPWLIMLELKPSTKRGYRDHVYGPDAAQGEFEVFKAALTMWKDRLEWNLKRR